ncbi:MAG: MATE family efflux transporter [Lachnospiraceae bacterium]|nr:MATE family efflux transporter [Lachnospiraceae bacterium]
MSSENAQPAENKMGVMPVPNLLFSMALPMMASMLVQALYNVVDSIFVAKLSEDALTAVSLAFPMQNLMIATISGVGVGMNALLSKRLGEKDFKGANRAACNGILLTGVVYLIFLFIGIFVTRSFFMGQTDIAHIVEDGTTYLTLVCVLSFGLFGQVIFERLLQSTGRTFYAMITQGTGAIINIILDPILIFGLFGAPKLGIAGAAVATIFGQSIAACLAFYFNVTKNKEIHLNLPDFKPDKPTIGRILYVGIPSILMVAIGSVMTFFMNRILMAFTSTAVAVFGAYFKLQSFIMMPVFGLNNGMVPIIAYNYGARKKERITKTIRLSIISAVGIMIVGLLILQIFPDKLLGLFDASEHMLSIGVPALRIISLSFIFAGFNIVSSSVFQAFGSGILSMLVSFARQLIVLLPAAWFLSKTGNVNLIWLSFPIAELMALALCSLFLKRTYSTIIKKL